MSARFFHLPLLGIPLLTSILAPILSGCNGDGEGMMEQGKNQPYIVLASASPRRWELLHGAGIRFVCHPADVDEALCHGEEPAAAVQRLAHTKAAAVAGGFPHEVVLGADTLVVLDGQALGKPCDLDDARRMLRLLSGRTHQVMTGVSLLRFAAAA